MRDVHPTCPPQPYFSEELVDILREYMLPQLAHANRKSCEEVIHVRDCGFTSSLQILGESGSAMEASRETSHIETLCRLQKYFATVLELVECYLTLRPLVEMFPQLMYVGHRQVQVIICLLHLGNLHALPDLAEI